MENLIIGCVVVIVFATATFVMMIRPMDIYLNYSMKRKINTKKIPLYFPNDRINESLYGPSLESPNEGTYLPAFVSSIVTYIISACLLVLLITIHFVLQNINITKWLACASFVLMLVNAVVCLVLREHYKKKYFAHQDEYKNKIIALKGANDSITVYN